MALKGGKSETQAIVQAIDRSNAVVRFTQDGVIIDANAKFLECMGCTIDEIRDQHHSIFVDPVHAASSEYAEFWAKLKSGEFISSEFLRFGKDGREVWLQATYNPVIGSNGQVEQIIKIATDVTERKLANVSGEGKIAAIEESMAVIEFDVNGTILRSNAMFRDIMEYSADEIDGQHHKMFVKTDYADSAEYKRFWTDLAAGKFNRGRFERVTKTGQSVWLEATYTPILNLRGQPYKVVKFAYDITENIKQAAMLEAALHEAQENERARIELDRVVQEMSTPVTPIWEGILLLPLVGVLDSMRAADIMKKSLSTISETGAKVYVIDISGVPTVDTAVANQLIKITKATRLMGCEAIVSGISPSIAHTMVELGINIDEIHTTATLRDAFETALAMVERRKRASQWDREAIASKRNAKP